MSMLTEQPGDGLVSEINVTPLVDVMLVLLTVFIVTAPLLMNAVNVNLPKAKAEVAQTQPKTLHLTIMANRTFVLDQTTLSLNALAQTLQTQHAEHDPALEIYADETVPYGDVAQAMAAIQRAGIRKFSFVMQPDQAH